MDAATRAELARLRRRAYGPAPDIDGDPDAVMRLIELEDLVRHEHAAAPDVETGPGTRHPEPREAVPTAQPREAVPTAPEPPRRRRPRAAAAIVGAAVVVAGVGVWLAGLTGAGTGGEPGAEAEATPTNRPIEGREAYSFARDDEAVELLHVPLDGSSATEIALPSEAYVPSFPTSGVVDWASSLGEYYGWNLWIAGAAGVVQREHCVLIERGSVQRGRCVPAVLRPNAALIVAVPYALVAPAERPIALDPNERLGFWWHDDGAVTILVGSDPPR